MFLLFFIGIFLKSVISEFEDEQIPQIQLNEVSTNSQDAFIELKSMEGVQPLTNFYIAIMDFAPLQNKNVATLNVRAIIDLKGKNYFENEIRLHELLLQILHFWAGIFF